ncbi:MAG: hypothetical protein R2764_16375 [Bacteroidales bacterium]
MAVAIVDVFGREVISKEIALERIVIDLREFGNGVYFLPVGD